MDAMLSASNGRFLAGFALVGAAVSIAMVRRDWWSAARAYGVASAAIATLGLLLLVIFGFGIQGDPQHVAPILAGYGVLLVASLRWTRHPAVIVTLGVVSLVASLQFAAYGAHGWTLPYPRTLALLANGTAMSLLMAVVAARTDSGWTPARTALVAWNIVISILALLTILTVSAGQREPIVTGYLLPIAFIWGLLAWVQRSSNWLVAAQAILAATILLAVDDVLAKQTWYTQSTNPRWLPLSLQCYGISLAVYALFINLAFAAMGRWKSASEDDGWRGGLARVRQLFDGQAVHVDHWSIAIGLAIAFGLSIYAVLPGIGQELHLLRTATERVVPPASDFLIRGVPHEGAGGLGTWCLFTAVGIALVSRQLNGHRMELNWNFVLITAALPLLIASQWDSQIAVASALRWSSAVVFCVVSIVAWMCHSGRKQLLMPNTVESLSKLAKPSRELAVWSGMLLAPLIGMMLYVVTQACGYMNPSADVRQIWYLASMMAAAAGAVVAGLVYGLKPQEGRARPENLVSWAAGLGIVGSSPFVAVSLFQLTLSLKQHPVLGPSPDSWFAQMGLAASYAIPLAVIALTLVGHAAQLRSISLAVGAGLLLNVSATAAYLLTQRVSSLGWDEWLRLGQLNASVSAAYALAWILAGQWRGQPIEDEFTSDAHESPYRESPALSSLGCQLTGIQRVMACGFFGLVIGVAALMLFVSPRRANELAHAGDLVAWVSFTLVMAANLVGVRGEPVAGRLSRWFAVIYLLVPLVALNPWFTSVTAPVWASYHLLEVGMLLCAVAALCLERLRSPSYLTSLLGIDEDNHSPARTGWIALTGLWAFTLLSVNELFRNSGHVTWCIVAVLVSVAVAIERGDRLQRQRWWALSMLLMSFAASFWWDTVARAWLPVQAETNHLVRVNLTALGLLLPVFVLLERRHSNVVPRRQATAVTAGILILMSIHTWLIVVGLAADLSGSFLRQPNPWVVWLSVASAVIGGASLLWGKQRRWAPLVGYVCCALVLGTLLDTQNLNGSQMLWAGTLMLACHGLATSYLWSRREELTRILEGIGIERQPSDTTSQWLLPLNISIASSVCVLGLIVAVTQDDAAIRLVVSQAIAAQAVAVGLLGRGKELSRLRSLALSILVVAAIGVGWSWLPVTTSWLNRSVVVASMLMLMAALYGIGLVKLLRGENAWTEAAKELVPSLVGLGILSLAGVLLSEIVMFSSTREVIMAWPAILAVSVALLVACAACLVAALVPGRDPLGLSESRRTVYVYAAEVLLAVLCLHLRITLPELFSGLVQRYWTLVVMAISFAGVGLSELFRRQEQRVLAEPLERTAILLPVLPVMGLWIGTGDVHLSAPLLVAGVLYASLSIMRKSFGFGVLAALFANGSLWYFLHDTVSIHLWVHPQVWLIPPAICVLVAGYFHRESLSDEQFKSLRYLSSSIIYVSSTADIFMNGVAENLWLPLILAALSLAGIFAGIMLRVRGFLFLGLAFLLVSLLTIIWHAAVDLDQTWLWYVTAIVVGVLIITLFAVFERKRQEVLGMVEQLKHWEA
jgi:hypothetical protein